MPKIVPKDSRYIPMTQQHWCCVPTCISMIMYRQGIPLVAPEELGYHMGLIVPEGQKHLFWNMTSGPEPEKGYGTRIYDKEYYPDKAFEKLGIPLRMIYRSIDEFIGLESFKKYLESVETDNKDALACFDYGTLYGTDSHGGHATLIDHVYNDNNEIRMVDPWIEAAKWQTVKIADLFAAMQFHGSGKMAGFWEFAATE